MPKAPPRWLDLHPGDTVFERMTTVSAVQHACRELEPLGYGFIWVDCGDHIVVQCVRSPRPLITTREETKE